MSGQKSNTKLGTDTQLIQLKDTNTPDAALNGPINFHQLFDHATETESTEQPTKVQQNVPLQHRTDRPITGARSRQTSESRTPRQAEKVSRPLGSSPVYGNIDLGTPITSTFQRHHTAAQPDLGGHRASSDTDAIVDMDTDKLDLHAMGLKKVPNATDIGKYRPPLAPPVESDEGYVRPQAIDLVDHRAAALPPDPQFMAPPPPVLERLNRPVLNTVTHGRVNPFRSQSPRKGEAQKFSEFLWEAKQSADINLPLDGGYALRDRLRRFLAICNIIKFAHNKGRLHRDIRPGNFQFDKKGRIYTSGWEGVHVDEDMVFRPGQPEATFFQLSEFQEVKPLGIWTPGGVVVASPRYVAPECLKHGADAHNKNSDVYALGVLLYEVLTLRTPFSGANLQAVLKRVALGKPGPFIHRNHSEVVPADLVRVCRNLLSTTPGERELDAAQLAQVVEAQIHQLGLVGPTQSQKPWILLGATAGVMALMAGGLLAYQDSLKGEAPAVHAKELAWLSHASVHADILDQYLSRQNLNTSMWSSAVKRVLGQKQFSDKAYYTQDKGSEEMGDTWVHSPIHGGQVSLTHGSYDFAFMADPDLSHGIAAKLQWLEPRFKSFLLGSHSPMATQLAAAEADALLLEKGTPAHRLFMTTQSGLHLYYPGQNRVMEDGRNAAYFEGAKGSRGVHWGQPQVSHDNRHVIIPVAHAIHRGQEFVGIAGMELLASHIVAELQQNAPQSHLGEAFIINEEGKILGRSTGTGPFSAPSLQNGGVILPELPYPQVLSAIGLDQPGWQSLDAQGNRIAAYIPLKSADWYYVAVSTEGGELQWSSDKRPALFASAQ